MTPRTEAPRTKPADTAEASERDTRMIGTYAGVLFVEAIVILALLILGRLFS